MQSEQKSALLLLDLQNEMVDPAGKIGGGGLAQRVAERGVLTNAERALRIARQRGDAIVHVRLGFRPDYADALSVAPRIARLKSGQAAIAGSWGCEFPAALAPRDGELVVTKQCVNPFFNTNLLPWLAAKGVRRLVLGGVATNLVVEATARAADDAGFAVMVLEDCCAAPNPDWHQFSIGQIIPMFGTVSSSTDYESTLPGQA